MSDAAPRGRYTSRDTSRDISLALAQIERRIEELEAEIVRVAPLVHERDRAPQDLAGIGSP
jgi:hypothetical protein